MGLEIQTSKQPGATIRTTPAPRPATIGLCILLLTVIQFVFVGLILDITIVRPPDQQLSASHMDPEVEQLPMAALLRSEQQIVSMWLAGAFFTLSFVIFLYQRYFMDQVVIAKRRFRKWEDEGVQFS